MLHLEYKVGDPSFKQLHMHFCAFIHLMKILK